MKILVTGGTGFVGKPLVNHLIARGHELTILTRQTISIKTTTSCRALSLETKVAAWNPDFGDELIPEVDGQEVIINLAGEPIAERKWTGEEKKRIFTSRIRATQKIVHSIQKAKFRPRVLINASAIGYYGSCDDRVLLEDAPHGFDFLAQVAHAWEREAHHARNFIERVVRLRFGIVIGKSGGVLPKISKPFRCFLGASLGSGRQWMSWIHLEDLIGLIEFCIQNENVSGPVNAVSPIPVTNIEFSKSLARSLSRPCWFAVPEFILKRILGERSSILLSSCRASSQKIESLGFSFHYPDLERALCSPV